MLSTANKYRVIFALGYPGEVITPTSTEFNSIVRDRLNIDNADVETRIVALLDKIDATKTKLEASPTKANVKSIGDIEFDTTQSLLLIQKELSRLVGELSKLLNLPDRSRRGRTVGVSL
jgi:hypothetical protein